MGIFKPEIDVMDYLVNYEVGDIDNPSLHLDWELGSV